MKELKEAIDKLTEKVTSLEAELHVAQESLNEVKSIKPTNYDGIQKWITEEFAPDFKTKIDEAISEKMNGNSNEEVMEAVKTWINDEFTSQMKSWVVEEFAPLVQDWIVEEFAPEVQNWVVEEFAPEVQNWVVEEYSPELQNWVTEEFAPEIQGWITEEFAPTMENWLMEEYTPEQSAIIEQKVNENVSAFMESQKAGRLEEIDGLLESIAADDNNDVNKIVKEQQEENKYKGIYVVENMPTEYLPSWQLLNEARQQEIIRTSKMYDFTKEGVLESFWANVEFSKKDEKQIDENVDPIQAYHNTIASQMRKMGKW
jgi:predicted house-cleaning noncanonical NTP pyrophosphatase (MazG superfamily)